MTDGETTLIVAGLTALFLSFGWIAITASLRLRRVQRYVARQMDRYPIASLENSIYSDLLTVIALGGDAEDRDFTLPPAADRD